MALYSAAAWKILDGGVQDGHLLTWEMGSIKSKVFIPESG